MLISQASFGQLPDHTNEQKSSSYIKEDSMNLATLVLDFLSFEFLEGTVNYYPLCDSCDLDSLPFFIEFMNPMDYGEILFKYSYNSDTLFYASIWWAGTGQIFYPEEFSPSIEFSYQEDVVVLPIHSQYYDYWLTPQGYSWQEFIEKADSAWRAIDSLQITNEFSEYSFRVGIYAYTPVLGMFDPTYAKWIIFLYYGNDQSTGISSPAGEGIQIKSYPNPFSTTTTIEYELSTISNIQFTIFNTMGEIVYQHEGNYNQGPHYFTWSPHHLPAGMYYVVLRSEEGVSVVKLIKQ